MVRGRGKQFLKTACKVWRIKTIVDRGQPGKLFHTSIFLAPAMCKGNFSCIIYDYSVVNTDI